MSSSHDLSHVLVALPNERTIRLPIKLATGTQIVETTALIDCGTTRNFICYAEDTCLLVSGLFGLTKGRCLRRDAMSFGKTKQD